MTKKAKRSKKAVAGSGGRSPYQPSTRKYVKPCRVKTRACSKQKVKGHPRCLPFTTRKGKNAKGERGLRCSSIKVKGYTRCTPRPGKSCGKPR